jgi:hypothetical protein
MFVFKSRRFQVGLARWPPLSRVQPFERTVLELFAARKALPDAPPWNPLSRSSVGCCVSGTFQLRRDLRHMPSLEMRARGLVITRLPGAIGARYRRA